MFSLSQSIQSTQQLMQLIDAYKGEIYGISFFMYFQNNYKNALNSSSIFQKLVAIETITSKELLKTLEKQKIDFEFNLEKIEIEMRHKGINDAQKWINLPWPQLISTLLDWVKPYQVLYHQQMLSVMEYSKTNGLESNFAFKILDKHETTIYHYLLAEQQKAANASFYLDDFIASYG